MADLKDIDGLMPIRSGRFHAALSSLAMRLEMLEGALESCANEWNEMYHNGRLMRFPDGKYGEDYGDLDMELAFESLAMTLCENIKERFGYEWKVTTRGRGGASVLPTSSIDHGHGCVGYGRPIFSDRNSFRRGDYPHSIDSDDIWASDSVIVDELTRITDDELVYLLDELGRVRKKSGGGLISPEYYAAALVLFEEQDWNVEIDGERVGPDEEVFLDEIDPQSELEVTRSLTDSAKNYAALVLEATVELDLLTAAFQYWNEFCRWAASGGFAEEINNMVESRKEGEAEEMEEQ